MLATLGDALDYFEELIDANVLDGDKSQDIERFLD